MKKSILFTLIFAISLYAMSKKPSFNKVDDWEYNSTVKMMNGGKFSKNISSPMITMATAPVMKKTLGFSVGGAKDAANFYENLKYNYLPKIDSITYEGVFYDHYFKSENSSDCKELFCPTYTTALSKNFFSGENEYFLSVGLDSNIKDLKRKKLNIVVVLDISGSMRSAFDKYYYDNNRKLKLKEEDATKSKMSIANESIANMIDHLKGDDKLGVILFDNQAYKAKPLRDIKTTDINAIKKHILSLKPKGGTNWSTGYREGIKLFDSLTDSLKDPTVYENRIIFITDAMPNRGELKKDGLLGIAKSASAANIYTTFIGVGVDFNNDLVEAISKTRGANYYSIHSSDEFKKRLDDEFDYMVTPLVFDLKLQLNSKSYKILAVYGSPDSNLATGEIMYVNTLFPTPTNENGSRGGVILLKLKKTSKNSDLKLSVSYKDRSDKAYQNEKKISFSDKAHFDDKSIQKAILLSSYVDLMKNYLLDMRRSCNDKIQTPYQTLKSSCGSYPPSRAIYPYIKTWERKSCPFILSDGYKKIFSSYKRYFESQMDEIGDNSLQKELDAINLILSKSKSKDKKKVDDWIQKK